MRINLSIPDELLKRVDESAKKLNMNRSAFVSMSITRQLESEQIINNLPSMLETFNNAIEESKQLRLNTALK